MDSDLNSSEDRNQKGSDKTPTLQVHVGNQKTDNSLPSDLEMPFVDHLEELRQRILRSLLAIVLGATISLLMVRPLVRILETPAGSIHFLQLAPGEFLFVSIKVAGYSGLILALPYILYQGLAFTLPGLTKKERRLIAPAVAASAIALGLVIKRDEDDCKPDSTS